MADYNSIHSGSNIDDTIGSSIIKVDDKAEALTKTPVAGQTMYIRSADGRGNIWRAVTGASAGTYSDDGGSYCGTVFIPTGGDGSSAWIRDYNGPLNIKWFGAKGDGVIDDGDVWRTAALALPTNGGVLKGTPGAIYLMEGAVADPYSSTPNLISVLFQNKSNIIIDLHGCTIKQTLATESTLGVFTFDTCTDCGVIGGKLSGYYSQPSSRSAALVAGIGACVGIHVDSKVVDGGRALAVFRSTDGLFGSPAPTKTTVIGSAFDCEYGVNYTHCGRAHTFDIIIGDVLRGAFITGTSGVTGKLTSDNSTSIIINAAVYLAQRDGSTCRDINIELNVVGCSAAVVCKVTDNTACLIEDINIYGYASTRGTSGVSDGLITLDDGNSESTMKCLHFENLQLISETETAPSFNLIAANTNAVYNGIWLPKDIQHAGYASAIQGFDACVIENTINASIVNIFASMSLWRMTNGSTTKRLITMSGGTINRVFLGGVFEHANSVGITDNIVISNCNTLSIDNAFVHADVDTAGSSNIRTGNNYINGVAWT